MAMNLSDALKILGIYAEYYQKRPSAAELKQMRRNDLIKHHPDKGGDSDKFTEVSMAWDRLMIHVAQEEIRKANQCEECNGTGWVEKKAQFGMTNVKCKKCKGTGQKCKKA